MKPIYIFIFIIISVIISVAYFIGYKKNIKYMKLMAAMLESALQPQDQTYTYLGGILGFSADYAVDGFAQVKANLRLIPRQSALYWPFLLITGAKDSLQLMFYLKKPIKEEFHVIKPSFLNFYKPHIYNREILKKDYIELNGKKMEILKEKKVNKALLKSIEHFDIKYFNHLAATTDYSIVYIQLHFLRFNEDKLQESIQKFKNSLIQ